MKKILANFIFLFHFQLIAQGVTDGKTSDSGIGGTSSTTGGAKQPVTHSKSNKPNKKSVSIMARPSPLMKTQTQTPLIGLRAAGQTDHSIVLLAFESIITN